MFNISTGLSIWCAEAMMASLLLFTAWRYSRNDRTFLFWAIGFLTSSLGFVLVVLRDYLPFEVSVLVGHGITLAAFSAWIAGFLALEGRRLEWWLALPATVWLLGMCLPWVYYDFSNRVALYNLATATGALGLCAATTMGNLRQDRIRTRLAIVFLLQTFLSFSIAVAVAVGDGTMERAIVFSAWVTLGSVAFMTLAFGLTCQLVMERSQKQLRRLSLTDMLTGVLNRRGLLTLFETVQERAFDSGREVAVLLFDLDHFKRINDRFGHQGGDMVLKAFADTARQFVPMNVFGRMGGEEFAAFAAVADQAEAEALAETIRAEFCRMPISTGFAIVPATVSVGVALATPLEAHCDRLISAADRALYAAKAAGRNCTVIFGTEEAAAPPPPEPRKDAGELVATLDDQIDALRRVGSLGR